MGSGKAEVAEDGSIGQRTQSEYIRSASIFPNSKSYPHYAYKRVMFNMSVVIKMFSIYNFLSYNMS